MPKIIRVHDPDEVERRVQFLIRGANYPGLLEFLGSLPHGAESALIRSILYQWFLIRQEEGTLESTIETLLAELPSKKKAGELKAGPSTLSDIGRLTGGSNSVDRTRSSNRSMTPPPGDTSITVSDAESRDGGGTNNGIDSPATRETNYSEKVNERSVDVGANDTEIDHGMLEDIGSFLGQQVT